MEVRVVAVDVGCGAGSTEAGSVDDDGSDVDGAAWGYCGAVAPENWGDLDEAYSMCATGLEQSPIDITGYVNGEGPSLDFSYVADGTLITNDGVFVEIKHDGRSTLRVGGVDYMLLRVHAHTPAEHTVEGVGFPLELHLVHSAADGSLAVVGLLYRAGAAHAGIASLVDAAPAADCESEPETPISAAVFLPEARAHYTYRGSLTTPPCSEGVRWMVMVNTQEASQEQVSAIMSLTDWIKNNRPVQPLGDRVITLTQG